MGRGLSLVVAAVAGLSAGCFGSDNPASSSGSILDQLAGIFSDAGHAAPASGARPVSLGAPVRTASAPFPTGGSQVFEPPGRSSVRQVAPADQASPGSGSVPDFLQPIPSSPNVRSVGGSTYQPPTQSSPNGSMVKAEGTDEPAATGVDGQQVKDPAIVTAENEYKPSDDGLPQQDGGSMLS